MEESLKHFNRVHLLAGITIFDKEKNKSKTWLLFQYFNVLIGLLTFVCTTIFVLSNLSDVLISIQGASVWTTGVVMFISLVICLLYRKEFRAFLEEMVLADLLLEMPLIQHVLQNQVKRGRSLQLKELVIGSQDKLFKLITVVLKAYVFFVSLSAILYLCGPIYLMSVRKDESLRLLAFDMWFPWGLENFTVYVASFLFHAYAGYLCCIAYSGIQSTIILLVGQIIRQLRILTFVLLNLDELVEELLQAKPELWQPGCTSVFSQCVEHYIKIKRFANRLNGIARTFYLALILAATILVCVCSVKIAISDKLSPDVIKYYVHEFCYTLVVLMFCYLGQAIDNECEKFEEAISEKWYIFDIKHRIHVRIFMMAARERMPIYIFGSVALSLPTFTWFIKTGMSFFTLIMSVIKE
ncbi:odorant receptor 13a-like [Pararge aegeria]|uniref:odorant receptor 13a-like n=1 Tax=Pararge aegeria TaxID=116150 RepID=UPI0019D136D4|nr:odorant receptor 13a-like [Pararge aegeria]